MSLIQMGVSARLGLKFSSYIKSSLQNELPKKLSLVLNCTFCEFSDSCVWGRIRALLLIISVFSPPVRILLAAESMRDFHFVGMPPGTILLTPISTRIEY
jgi:hypothetical protein